MAEHVQEALDRMVAPLRDLTERKIFSESEVQDIVSRRRESEYLLRRHTARKADFLRYIDAEQKLEEVRKERTLEIKRIEKEERRRRARLGELEDEDDQMKTGGKNEHIGDAHIMQLIHLLYVRTIRRFRSDLSLHLQHAEYCKQNKSWTRLGRVYAEALQIFPSQDGLWIEAASHEFFGPTRSIRNSRILMQRGIRRNGATSQDLWVEYFTLEMHFAQTMRGRRQILMQEDKPEEEPKDDDDESLSKIPLIVYKNAIETIPDSVSFRLRFLDVCQRFPDTDLIVAAIQATLERDFENTPEAWIARAMYAAETGATSPQNKLLAIDKAAAQFALEGKDDEEKGEAETDRPKKKQRKESSSPVISVLYQAIEAVQTDDMYLQALRFSRSFQKSNENAGQRAISKEAIGFIDHLMERISEKSSAELVLEQVDYLREQKRPEEAIEALKNRCTNGPKSATKATLWIKWAQMQKSNSVSILERASRAISVTSHDHLKVLLQLLGAILRQKKISPKLETKLTDTFQSIQLLAAGAPDLVVEEDSFGVATVADACCAYVRHCSPAGGARGAYQSILFSSSIIRLQEENTDAVRALIDACIDIEKEGNDKRRLLRLYDKAMEIFRGTSLEETYKEDRDLAVYS